MKGLIAIVFLVASFACLWGGGWIVYLLRDTWAVFPAILTTMIFFMAFLVLGISAVGVWANE